MRLTTDDKIDSVVDGYNIPVRRISVLTLPRGLVPVSLLQRAAGGELAGMSGVGRRFCQQSPASGPLLSKPIM